MPSPIRGLRGRVVQFHEAAEEKNAENLLVVKDKKLAERYAENWREHEKHSVPYDGKG